MALYTHLPLYKASYTLLLEINKMLVNVPRDSRFSIGQDLRHCVMQIILSIYRANSCTRKVSIIRHMRSLLVQVQVYIRLLCDMRHISEKQYLRLVEQTTAMSKQMAAWEKSQTGKQEN